MGRTLNYRIITIRIVKLRIPLNRIVESTKIIKSHDRITTCNNNVLPMCKSSLIRHTCNHSSLDHFLLSKKFRKTSIFLLEINTNM